MESSKHYVINTVIDEEYKVAYEGHDAKVEIKPNLDEKKVKVECKVEGILMENEYPINLMKPDNINTLQTYLEEALKQDLMNLISKTQHELQSDILGVGSKIHQKDPKKIGQRLMAIGKKFIQRLKFEEMLKFRLILIGDIANLKRLEKESLL